MNQEKKADSVEFDALDSRHTVRLVPSSWIALEDAGLGDVKTLAAKLEGQPSFKTFMMVFAAGLRGGMKGTDITDERALEIADDIGTERMIEIVGEVVTLSFPKAKAAKEGNGTKPAQAKT
jgi:hypothetical protein